MKMLSNIKNGCAFNLEGEFIDHIYSGDAVGVVSLTSAPIVYVYDKPQQLKCLQRLIGHRGITGDCKVLRMSDGKYLGSIEIVSAEDSLQWNHEGGAYGVSRATLEDSGRQLTLCHSGWASDGDTKYFSVHLEVKGVPIEGPSYMEISGPWPTTVVQMFARHLDDYGVKISEDALSVLAMAALKEWARTHSNYSAHEMYYGL